LKAAAVPIGGCQLLGSLEVVGDNLAVRAGWVAVDLGQIVLADLLGQCAEGVFNALDVTRQFIHFCADGEELGEDVFVCGEFDVATFF
jgi:hypothetical protein